MKVKDMISLLEQLDPEKNIECFNNHGCWWGGPIEIHKILGHYVLVPNSNMKEKEIEK